MLERDKNGKERDRGWTCDLVPEPLLVARHYARVQQFIDQLSGDAEAVGARIGELEEEHGGEEGLLSELEKVNRASVTARLKEIKDDPKSAEEAGVLVAWLGLNAEETELKKRVRHLRRGPARAWPQAGRAGGGHRCRTVGGRPPPGIHTAHYHRGRLPDLGKNPAAIDLYLRARHAYKYHEYGALLRSLKLFEQALERVPEDPLILAGFVCASTRALAFSRSAAADTAELPSPSRIRESAMRALTLAPHLAEVHLALVVLTMGDGQPVESAGHLRQALRFGPGLAEVHEMAGWMLLETGYLLEAIERLKSANILDPQLLPPG